jgi:hypothetical protein
MKSIDYSDIDRSVLKDHTSQNTSEHETTRVNTSQKFVNTSQKLTNTSEHESEMTNTSQKSVNTSQKRINS